MTFSCMKSQSVSWTEQLDRDTAMLNVSNERERDRERKKGKLTEY